MQAPQSPAAWERLWDLFHAALEREGADRSAFLAAACAGDAELQGEVERLLASHERAGAVLDRAPALAGVHEASADDGHPPGALDEVLPAGTLLAGRFEIVRLCGTGGMGVVYQAVDRELGTSVALKTLLPEVAGNPRAHQRFRHEINLARRVTHPNACRIFDLFHHDRPGDDPVTFLTMELLAGDTLAERLAREGPLPAAQVLPVVVQVAAALEAAHREGVIHRDLKPANIMLVPEGQGVRAVVTDFGVAHLVGDGSQRSLATATWQLLGTPEYMAPEQLRRGPVSPATDVYGLGLVLHELLTGVLPHSGDTPISAALERPAAGAPTPRRRGRILDPRWQRVIQRCLQPDPADRFASPDAVVRALRGDGRWWHPRRARRRLAMAAVALLLGAGLALLRTRLDTGPESAERVPAGGAAAATAPWVLVAGFDNRTGEALLDDTVAYALQRELANSRFVRVLPRDRVADALQLLRQPPDARLEGDLARQVALRDGTISVIVSGRIERLGANYAISAELLDPTSGRLLAGLAEEAAGQEGVLAAVRRLASATREALGEAPPRIRASEQELARVTTPSLPALRLFTRGEGLIAQGNHAAAEELLREAVAVDPGFASGWIYLAYALRNQGKPRAEWLPPAQQALALAPSASEREAAFIRASCASMLGDWERALAGFQALLSLHPEDFWAHNNLALLLESLDRHAEAVPHAVARADLRPNLLWPQQRAAQALAIWARRPAAAEPYLRRAQALLAVLPVEGRLTNLTEAWLTAYPAHRQWVAGEPERVEEVVREIEQRLVELSGRRRQEHAWVLAHLQRALGRYATAETLFAQSYPPSHRAHLATAAFLTGGPLAALPHLEQSLAESPSAHRFEPLRLVLLAKAGRAEQARAGLAAWQRLDAAGGKVVPGQPSAAAAMPSPPRGGGPIAPPGALLLVRGEIALAEGDLAGAVPLLQRGLQEEQASGSAIYFLGATSLAEAYSRRGESQKAVQVLVAAGADQQRAYLGGEAYWTWARWRLAQLYRELGHPTEAAAVESELRSLLRLADDGWWPWRREEWQPPPPG